MIPNMTARRWMALALLSALAAGRPQEDPAASHPKGPPRFLVVAAAEDAGAGLLAWSDDESIALITDRGERAFRWEDLRPYSVWRARSILAGRDAAKHLQLAAYCKEHKLPRQARWEYAAAKSLDPKVEIPDLEELRKLDAEAFIPNALAMAPTAIGKQLEKETADAIAARAAAE